MQLFISPKSVMWRNPKKRPRERYVSEYALLEIRESEWVSHSVIC